MLRVFRDRYCSMQLRHYLCGGLVAFSLLVSFGCSERVFVPTPAETDVQKTAKALGPDYKPLNDEDLKAMHVTQAQFDEINRESNIWIDLLRKHPEPSPHYNFRSFEDIKLGREEWPVEGRFVPANAGTRARTPGLFGRLTGNAARADHLVIFMPGGPGHSFRDPTLAEWLRRNFDFAPIDLLLVNYSGADEQLGPLRQRLRREGLPAFSRDAREMAPALATIAKPYQHVVLLTGSLSTLLGVELLKTAPGLADCAIFEVPWAEYQNSADFFAPGRPHFPPGRDGPAERAAYVSRNLLELRIDETKPTDPSREWMKSVRERAVLPVPTLALLAQWDDRMDVKAAEAFWKKLGADTRIEPKVYHENILETSSKVDYEKRTIQYLPAQGRLDIQEFAGHCGR